MTCVMFRLLFLVFSLCLVTCFGGSVINLTKKNFASEVFADNKPFIVEFFAPWCGHCKQLAPIYEKVATKLKGLVGVGAVNCDEEKELCGQFGIRGFPTLKLFGPNRNKKGTKEPSDYQGARSVGGIANAGLALLTDKNIRVVTAKSSLDPLIKEKKSVVLFSKKSEPANMFKALSMQYKGRINFVLVPQAGNEETAKRFGVESYPTLIVVKEDGTHEAYKGKLKIAQIAAFVDKFADPAPKKQKQQSGGEQQEKPKEKVVEYDQKVEQITTQEKWDEKCTTKAGFCGVAFFDMEDEAEKERNAKFIGILEEVVKKVYKNVHVMWVNAPTQYEFYSKFNLGGGFPAFALYQPKLKRVVPFRGSFSEEDIIEYVDKVLTGRPQSYSVEGLEIK